VLGAVASASTANIITYAIIHNMLILKIKNDFSAIYSQPSFQNNKQYLKS